MCCTKSVQYIRLIFIGRVNRTMTFQYSQLTDLIVHVAPSETELLMLIRQILQTRIPYSVIDGEWHSTMPLLTK